MDLAGATACVENTERHHWDCHCVFHPQERSTRNPLRRFWRTWNMYASIRQWIVLYYCIQCLQDRSITGTTEYSYCVTSFMFFSQLKHSSINCNILFRWLINLRGIYPTMKKLNCPWLYEPARLLSQLLFQIHHCEFAQIRHCEFGPNPPRPFNLAKHINNR